MEKTGEAGKKFVEKKKRGEPTHSMGLRGKAKADATSHRELLKIIETAENAKTKKRRLTTLERTALEGANYVEHKRAKHS